MEFIVYNKLVEDAKKIRKIVFVQEQGFIEEFDGVDAYAKHLVLYDNNTPIAVCRFFKKEIVDEYFIGRIAVIKQYRGKGIGNYLLKCAEEEIKKLGGKKIFLHSQESAKKFYEINGYTSYGEIDFEENCPHIWMFKKI